MKRESQKVRAVQLEDGMVFTLHEKYTLMFENKLFHEVAFEGYEIEPCINPIWTKTGVVYTIEEVNNLKG